MPGQGRPLTAFVVVVWMLAAAADAQEPRRLNAGPTLPVARQPVPIEDDAKLYDIRFVGSKIGWAVGDHGVIWKTEDAGKSWRLLPAMVRCPLRSVCFLTDRVGWIVGGGTTPYTRIGYGVVLFTSDGGDTWQRLDAGKLPQLNFVKFFGLQQGVAVGQSSSEFPTGICITRDGGKTWSNVPGRHGTGWRTADFSSAQVGAVAGVNGRAALVGGGRLLQPRIDPTGLRGFQDVKLNRDNSGWLVGDGGLVLRTENGGVVWQDPPRSLPAELREMVDFRAVETRGGNVWIAGQPGSSIWHSPDGGRNWQKQPTGQTVPINALWFTSETNGWAVGELGLMLQTADGGRTWKAIRGVDRRVALMSIHSRPTQVAFHLMAKQAGDRGYRSLVLLPARHDIGPDGDAATEMNVRLHEAVTSVGASAGEIDWQFPLAVPGIERNSNRLLADWNRRTEGRLEEIFLGKLVSVLRTWRPNVIVIDEPSADDAAGEFLRDAVIRAVAQAADSTRFIQHRELAGLNSWKVDRVYLKLAEGSVGNAHVDLHQLLPRLGTSVHSAAVAGQSKLLPMTPTASTREAYRLLIDQVGEAPGNAASVDFFTGIALNPGSAARRRLARFDERNYELRQKIVQRQRNFHAYTKKFLDDPRKAAQVIAQLNQITAGMPKSEAALQLAQLADEYRQRADWELVEATLVELVERYPDEPVALDGMRWLLQMWSAVEPAWQRAREVNVGRQRITSNPDSVRSRVLKATRLSQIDPYERDLRETEMGPDPLAVVQTAGQLKVDQQERWRNGAVRNWHEQALRMASLIRSRSPSLYRSPEIQFPLASLLRQRGSSRLSETFYRRFNAMAAGNPWKEIAGGELWLANPISLPPKAVASCGRAQQRPRLDGVLSDACWQQAQELPLRSGQEQTDDGKPYAFAMVSYDDEYMYFAVTVPRAPGTRGDLPKTKGRKHDADLRDFDRVSLFLDLDRDYSTFYALHVDQRGQVAEECWGNSRWNPEKCHVAVDADERRWRIELAIAHSELSPTAPAKNHVWAVGIVRTIPAVGVQSWTQPAASRPRPETFGFLKFE